MHFASSHSNRWLQLVDCVAFICNRREGFLNGVEGDERARKAVMMMFSRFIEPALRWYDVDAPGPARPR